MKARPELAPGPVEAAEPKQRNRSRPRGSVRSDKGLGPGPGENPEASAQARAPQGHSRGMSSALPPPEDLIKLLCDDSPATVAAVKGALRQMGPEAEDALQDAVASDDAMLRGRARQLLAEIQRERGLARLRSLLGTSGTGPVDGANTTGEPEAVNSGVDIIDGLLAIDGLLGVAQDEEVREQLDDWADGLRAALPARPSTADLAAALGNTLGGEAGLQGPESDYHHLDHVSLSRTIQTGRALPLTLCAIYAATARLAGYEAGLLPFPGHVLLGVGPEENRAILDPFAGGTRMTEEACLVRLGALGAPPSQRWLRPASDRAMLVRQLLNTQAALKRHGRMRDARIIGSLLNEADPGG